MKKIIFITIVAFVASLASCKKDRTCTCTYLGSSKPDVTVYTKAKKSDARAACLSITYVGGSRTCTLK